MNLDYFMETQLVISKSPTSAWDLLQKIDNLFGHPSTLAQQLDQVNHLVLEALQVDAIWFLTTQPLPPTACGLVHTPLSMSPHAKISVMDQGPPLNDMGVYDPDTLLGQVLENKRPFFVQPGQQPHRTDCDLGDTLFSTFHVIPLAIIPLVAHRRALGALIIGNRDPARSFLSPETRQVLAFLVPYLAQKLQNVYLIDRSNQYTSALVTLNEIAHTITSSLKIDDVIQRTMAGINALLDVEAGSLLLLDEKTGELYFKITLRGENKEVASYRLQSGEGIAGWAIQNNRPTISNRPRNDRRFSPRIDQAIGFTTRNVLCTPLIVQGRPIGVLEVINKRSGPFSEADQDLLVSMTASLGIALQNALLYEEAQEQARINNVINQVAAVINACHGLSETAKVIFTQFRRLFTFDHISISLLDDSKQKIRQWTFGSYGYIQEVKQPIALTESRLTQIIKARTGYLDGDLLSEKTPGQIYPDDQILLLDKIRSRMTVLLTAKKVPYGAFNLGSQQPYSYSAPELKLLEELAPQIAIAIEKAVLIDKMEQRNTELQLLNRLGEMLVSTTDIALIVDTALHMLPRLLPGDVQGIVVAGEEGCYAGAAIPFGFSKPNHMVNEIFKTFLEMSDGSSLTQMISSKTIAGNMPVQDDWEPVTVLALPILTGRGAQGVIYMASGKEESLSDDLFRIFSLIVSQISVAVENAHLFQQVEQERGRLAAILASSTDAVLVVNRNGRIVLDNPAAWEVLGAQESQSGRLLSESTSLRILIDLFNSAMQGGNLTGEIPLDNGRTFFANLSPVSAGDENVVGWVATMQDVSHFKEVNQLKNDFVNTVSHDLRSPLSGILLAVSMITEVGQVNSDQQQLLQVVEKRVKAMGELIDDLLDVGKIEAGIGMEMEPQNLTAIIEDVTVALTPQLQEKNIQYLSLLDEQLPPVLVNTTRIRQVLHNLVGNAIKYTNNQGRVTVKAFAQDGEVRIQVIDTGMGIPAGDQPHVFEKFYRVRGEQALAVKGTGLGLAIAKSIVEKHQGRIWLESVFGEGSAFTVALPVYDPHDV